jgi:kynurenine aminotransferase
MQEKLTRVCAIFDEFGLPYPDPQGGYFVLADLSKAKWPETCEWPDHVKHRPRDFKLSWFCIMEIGDAVISPTEFYADENAHLAEDWLRFAVCKNDDGLNLARERPMELKRYMTA